MSNYLAVAVKKINTLIKDQGGRIMEINDKHVVIAFDNNTCTVDTFGKVGWDA